MTPSLLRLVLVVCAAKVVVTTLAADKLPSFIEPGEISIRFADEHLQALRVDARKYVPAQVQAFGKTWPDARARLKGSGTFQPIDGTPSFTLDLGDSKIHLNNSLDDPSRLNEFVGSYLAKTAGMQVPQVGHAIVTLNGRRLGLYVVKESFDLPGVELDNEPVPAWEVFHKRIAAESFARFVALEVMMCHWDGYSLRRNNFEVSESSNNRLVFLPSGMDQLFGKSDLAWRLEMTGPLARALMGFPEGKELYERQFREVFQSVFDSQAIRKIIHERVEQLKPILRESEFAEMSEHANELYERISQRETYLRAQLTNPDSGAPAIFTNGRLALTGWEAADASTNAVRRTVEHLGIIAPKGSFSSWRTTVSLGKGSYRFQGKVRVNEAVPLAFGKTHGATLRVAGKMLNSQELLGTTDWKPLNADFEVAEDQESVVLICQFRAISGEAWFDIGSLELLRL